jgi:dynein heavy chain
MSNQIADESPTLNQPQESNVNENEKSTLVEQPDEEKDPVESGSFHSENDLRDDNSLDSDASSLSKKEREEKSVLLELLYNCLDNHLEAFHSSMFTPEVQTSILRFFDNEVTRAFAWVEKNGVRLEFSDFPGMEEAPAEESFQLLFMWKFGTEPLTSRNFANAVGCKSLRLSKNLSELIDDLSFNLIPNLIKDSQWPENVRKDLLGLTYKFVCNLTELQSQKDGKILLYIPNESLDQFAETAGVNSQEHKDLCARLECVLMHWVKQIKDLLNSQSSQNDNDSSGLIEEVHFWSNCKENLVNLRSQLQNKTIRKVLNLLSFGNSSHTTAFETLSENIVKGATQAEENLRFLRILEVPCQQINTLSAEAIPSVLQSVFYSIRMLWQHCSYYSSEEKVAGLFRKVSNQIIRRCSETINLNDLFEGNVMSCVVVLDNSIRCLKKWRECYDKNTSSMKRKLCWKFGADSIFAQIEAFIQRCYDLKEICEGQIQFARKGIESQMPIFSGSKNDEIVAMLDEIKENFQKQLARLSGANKNRILDIKSTKWHEDYNVFKAGMKNLDNLYTNLITFAFENIFTVQQAVESMIGFKTITRRDSIVLHVAKKIERVNELTVREFHNLEQLSKLPPSHLYRGKHSAKALWNAGLLQRLQSVKRLYERLHFVEQFYKDQVETEFVRIENVLKVNMANASKDFREANKDLEATLSKRLDQNILVENSNKPSTVAAIVCKNNSKGNEGRSLKSRRYIESNFDRSLLSFMVELDTFKRLQAQGVQSFGGKLEEFADNQKEKLSVYRKNVMLVVMDYNAILELTSDFESELFSEHIENINSSVYRGLKILRWSSQGTLDNFVKECRAKCELVSEKVLRFKRVQDGVESEVRNTFSRLRFIHFDPRKVQEVPQFLQMQDMVAMTTREALSRLVASVVESLEEVYLNFIDKGERVQQSWLSFLKRIDRLIEEEFRRQFKGVFQELLKAIVGDEKSKTNPTQIFKIHIVLKGGEQENKLDFEPTLSDFQSGVSRVMKRPIDELADFPRLPHLMVGSRTRKIADIVELLQKGDKNDKENKADKNGLLAGLSKKFAGTFFDIPASWLAEVAPTYQAAVLEEVQGLQNEVLKNLKGQCSRLVNQLEPWRKNCFLLTGANEYSEFTNFVVEKNTPVANLRTAVEYYDVIQTEIQVEKSNDDSLCIQVDTNRIKKKLINLNYEEQKMLLNRIKEKAVEELRGLTRRFTDSEKQLAVLPTDLKKLRESIELWESLNAKRAFTEESLGPLEEKFKLLDDYMIVLKDEETRMRVSVRENFDRFYGLLEVIKKRNDGYYQMQLSDHLKRLQDFEQELRDNRLKLLKEMPTRIEPGLTCETAFARINVFKAYLGEVRDSEKRMEFGFELFGIKYVPVPEIAVMVEEIENLESFWELQSRWTAQLEEHLDSQFFAIDIKAIQLLCKGIRGQLLAFPKPIQAYELTAEMVAQLDLYVHNTELIELLKEDYLRDRHWKVIRENLKENFDTKDKSFTLRRIMGMGLENLTDPIREVCETAFAESKIENLLDEIIGRWEKEEMVFEQLKFSSVKIISGAYAEKVEQFLEEDLVQLSSLKSNAYAFAFSRQIELWDAELNRVSEITDLLMCVQKKFVYFNNIFGNLTEDIGQLIGDKNLFNNVKINLLGYLNRFETERNTKRNLLTANFKDVLAEMSLQLDTIQRHMKKYLEKRKYETPRFYFLSDEDIFEILGKAKDPTCLSRFWKKMFEGIRSLDFQPVQTSKGKSFEYTRIVSPEEERLELYNKIEVNGDLNNVLGAIEREMVHRLKTLLFECLSHAADGQSGIKNTDKLEKMLFEFPGQILLVSCQLSWTNRCFQALLGSIGEEKGAKGPKKNLAVKDNWATLKQFYQKHLADLVALIRKNNDDLVKRKLVALITVEVHHKDLLETLSSASIGSFEWQSQLKYLRIDESQDKVDVKVEQMTAKLDYAFEYQGNNGRLVITPLTDRCYLTLTSAMNFKRGGNPQGPAGTGKTETVKDLGKNLGRFVFVFNCSEGIDVRNMKNMFEGLAQTGFWGCFDEFNRIEVEVLSVIAIQINSLLEAMAVEAKVFNLDEKEIPLNRNCAIFITMNPGYAGRSELPDNLKSLFRPIAMIVPDSVQICRIALQAEGFRSADFLARKLENLYTLMKQTLSSQHQYDFGLRDIKSVLVMAGELRRRSCRDSDKRTKESEGQFEQTLLLRAFYSINEPKLVSEDLPLFEGLLNDLFPEDYKTARGDQDEDFIKQIDRVLDSLNLDKTGYFVEKVSQLANTKQSRHGTILIGKSMSGKSTLIKVLEQTQVLCNRPTRRFTLNPKVLSIGELYGSYNPSADQSVLGVFSHLMDQLCNKDDSGDERWIVFDGPIDTHWIENMNSLLDDNKVLTLVDGNRINLKEGVKLMFEVDELTQASPATVSRCGIVFMDEKELTWQSIRTGWVLGKDSQGVPEEVLQFFDDLFDKWMEPLLARKATLPGAEVSPIAETAQVRNCCRLFDIFMAKLPLDFRSPALVEDDQAVHLLEKVFVFCVIWTVGSNLNAAGKTLFDNTLRDIESILPFSQTIFDYFISLEKGKFILWEEKLTVQPPQWKPPQDLPNSDLMVETVDTARVRFIVNTLLEDRENVLLVGPSSVGKTLLVKTILRSMDDNAFSFNVLNLTAGTTSQRLQESIEGKLNRTTKKKFRPFSGKRGFVFVDDLAMPRKDSSGYQPTLELLRQVVEYNGWYDRASLDLFVQIKEVSYVAAIRENQAVPNRLLNKLFVLGILQPSESQLRRIYNSILYFSMNEFDGEEIKSEIENLVSFVIGVFRTVQADDAFITTPARPHYIFSLKDISRIVQGVSMIDKVNCDSKGILLKLAFHETVRVLEDRMMSPADSEQMRRRIVEQFDSCFDLKAAFLMPNDEDPVFVSFVDVRGAYACVTPRNGNETALDLLKGTLEDFLCQFNKDQKASISLSLFAEAVLAVCRICRVLTMPKGHLLLIGEPGTGKHSLTRLAAFVCQLQVVEQKCSTAMAFRTELKSVFESVLFKGTRVVLLMGENDLKFPDILQDANSLLSLGEVPSLFAKREGRDEFGKIRDKIKIDIKKDNEEAIFDHFLETVQNSTHLVLCAPRDDSLRQLIRDHGGFVYNTTQVCLGGWPQSALLQVASRFLAKLDFSNGKDLAEFFATVHNDIGVYLGEGHPASASAQSSKAQTAQTVPTASKPAQSAPASSTSPSGTPALSPKTFIDFQRTFQAILQRKLAELDQKIHKYQTGIQRLEETQRSVEEMKGAMDVKRIELHKKKKECEEMIFKIDFEKRESAKEKKNIEEKEELLTKEKEDTQKLASAAKLQLEKAEPVLLEAKNKVKDLDNNSIAEIKVLLKTKDKRLELIMFSLMVLLGEKPKWDSVQKAVTDANFLKKIREMEMDKIDEPVVQKLEQYTQQPEIQGSLESFSRSVNILANFIKAVEVYVKVNLDVKPIRDNVIKLNKQLEAKEEELQRLKDNLAATLDRLESLNSLFDSLNAEYQQFLTDFAQLEQRLERAEKLVAGLSYSFDSWVSYLKLYLDSKEKLVGNILLSAAVLTYFGPLSFEQRQHVSAEILLPFLQRRKVPHSADFNFVSFLVEEVVLLSWNFKGLPNDPTSMENAVIVHHALNWPYIVDPQSQCLNWLKNMEGSNKLVLLDYTAPRQAQVVEKCLVEGAVLIYQHGGEELPDCVQYLLDRRVEKALDRTLFSFGDKDLVLHPSFKCYLTTREGCPALKQQILSRVTLVNFTVVQKGLEEQLLGLVLRVLDEKLENQRVESIKVKSNCEVILRELEDRVLEILSKDDGKPLVDSEELIDTLQTSREKEEEIKGTLETTKANFKKITHSRESYRALGYLASVLYFAVSQMVRINSVYQFSLDSYFREFEYVLSKVNDRKNDMSDSLAEKVKRIDSELRRKIHRRYCEFLFEKDRLLLSFIMAVTLDPIDQRMNMAGKADEKAKRFGGKGSAESLDAEEPKQNYYEQDFGQEFGFFMKPFAVLPPETQEGNPDPSWISPAVWDTVNQLNTLSTFQGIVGSFLHNTKEWRKFFLSPRPEAEVLPSDWSQKIKRFSFVLLIKILRPDRLLFVVADFVRAILGPTFVASPGFSFERVHAKIVKKKRPTPILIVLGPNVDPFAYIDQCAKKQGVVVHQISLGQGQLARAKEKVLKGIQEGFWVYLGNVHLSPLFMKDLDALLDQCRTQTRGFGFQLIMSSKPADCLSLNLLQGSYKVVLEPVKGVKANLVRTISNLLPDFKPADEKEAIGEFILYRKLCFSLCWLHSLLNERKRFRSLGWNIPYEFSDTDLVYSEKIIAEFIVNASRGGDQGFQWDAFRFLLGQINYGGRVTDQWDMRLLQVLVREVFCEEMVANKEFSLSGDASGPYRLPPGLDDSFANAKNKTGINFGALFAGYRADLLSFVKELPDHETPDVFGQHINAEITMRIENSKVFLDSLSTFESRQALAEVDSTQTELNLAKLVDELTEKLHSKIPLTDFCEKLKLTDKDANSSFVDPLSVFFLQEAKKCNAILEIVREDLNVVANCLKGKTIMTEDIEAMIASLKMMRLPAKWQGFYFSIKTLGPWVDDLNKRVDQVVEWTTKGGLVKYWLGGFCYPNGFLTAVLQTTARKTGVSIDSLKWDFQFMGLESLVTSSPKEGVYVSGMFLEGGKFTTAENRLVEADPMTLYCPMPVVHFRPVEKNSKTIVKSNTYNCPVYIYPIRQNSNDNSSYLFSVSLPYTTRKEVSEAYWIKRGTALLLSLDN